MRIPLSWLKEYVDLDETPQQIADRLTFSGTEVEGIETIGSTYTGFLVAEVRSVEKHPQADKLSLCRVFDGQQELQVVCGAPNVQAGGRYPFAPVGVTLPDGSLTIKKAKIRGCESFGMLCSADELGLSQDHSGLLVLDASWAAGTPLATVLGPPETVFELEVTPNRPDCLSLIGIARELAAVYRRPLKIPAVALAESGPALETLARVEVQDPDGCPALYGARAAGPSGGAVPRLDAEAPATGRHPRHQQPGRYHQLRDAGVRAAPARVRPRPAAGGPHRGAARPGRRADADAGQRGPRAGRQHPRHRRCRAAGRGGGRDGRGGQRDPRRHLVRAAGKRCLQAHRHPRHRAPARALHRVVLPLRARRGCGERGVGQPPGRRPDGGAGRRNGGARGDRCAAPAGSAPLHPLPLRLRARRGGRSRHQPRDCGRVPRPGAGRDRGDGAGPGGGGALVPARPGARD
jgi:tRNA-binding EMAP/Myf-like protein